MGASGWSYTVPYQSDIDAALQQLRNDVFARGDYHKPWEESRQFRQNLESRPFDQLQPHERQWLRMLRSVPDQGETPELTTIDELLEHNAESGTHSILDIIGIGEEVEFGTAAPTPDAVLLASFGTTQPTREQYAQPRAAYHRFVEDLERWQAVYLVLYKDGKPHEIVFEGNSGD